MADITAIQAHNQLQGRMMTTDPLTELHTAANAEAEAKDRWTHAHNALIEARKSEEIARQSFRTASARRSLAFARVSAHHRMPIHELRHAVAPVVIRDPAKLQAENRIGVRAAAVLALRRAGEPMLALALGPIVGIPPRAVRNYLDGDARFIIDHVRHGSREAVRVRLAD